MKTYNVTVTMEVTYELELEVIASSEEEAKKRADIIAQGNCDLGTMVHSSDRRFTIVG